MLNQGASENFLSAVAASPAGMAFAAGYLSDQVWTSLRPAMAAIGTVPNVAGDTPAAATGAMDSAGLHTTITDVTTAGGGCGPATNGTIIATTPAAGTLTAPPVTMTFCDFPPVVTVPGVTGLADNQAQGTLTDAGLTTGTITLSGNCTFDPGTVLRQTPAAGTTVNRGTAVNLTEATPPKPHGCAQ
jgi:beta-lactam-binding protein with PASTA domain